MYTTIYNMWIFLTRSLPRLELLVQDNLKCVKLRELSEAFKLRNLKQGIIPSSKGLVFYYFIFQSTILAWYHLENFAKCNQSRY